MERFGLEGFLGAFTGNLLSLASGGLFGRSSQSLSSSAGDVTLEPRSGAGASVRRLSCPLSRHAVPHLYPTIPTIPIIPHYILTVPHRRKYPKARKWFNRAVTLDPDIGDVWYAVGGNVTGNMAGSVTENVVKRVGYRAGDLSDSACCDSTCCDSKGGLLQVRARAWRRRAAGANRS